MDLGAQIAAKILEAIDRGTDLYILDHYVTGPGCLARVRGFLIEERDACADAERADFLASILHGLEKGVPDPEEGRRSEKGGIADS